MEKQNKDNKLNITMVAWTYVLNFSWVNNVFFTREMTIQNISKGTSFDKLKFHGI